MKWEIEEEEMEKKMETGEQETEEEKKTNKKHRILKGVIRDAILEIKQEEALKEFLRIEKKLIFDIKFFKALGFIALIIFGIDEAFLYFNNQPKEVIAVSQAFNFVVLLAGLLAFVQCFALKITFNRMKQKPLNEITPEYIQELKNCPFIN